LKKYAILFHLLMGSIFNLLLSQGIGGFRLDAYRWQAVIVNQVEKQSKEHRQASRGYTGIHVICV
jgi:hypothetical protein